MPKIWLTPQHIPTPVGFQNTLGGHPLVTQALVNRGFNDVRSAMGFLNPTFYKPSPPNEFKDIAHSVNRISAAIQDQEPILVWGDFDVDGQTATTLLVQALGELGANIHYHIPVRATEGHGIKKNVLERFLERNPKPKIIITCDTGISEHDAIEFASSRGVDVIITDHHELPERLPNAFSVINPHLFPINHPLSTLPGVGVAYKLIEELFNIENNISSLDKYLDLVALGIVADVAVLTGDTRYLLQKGLDTLRETSRIGLKSLFETADISPDQINEDHIGFSIGPRLNALGRLSDANPIVDFFTTNDLNRANTFANQLEKLNHRRKLLTDQVYQGALSKIEQNPNTLDSAILVLSHTNWPIGILGIVASRLVEKFNIPTILFTVQNETQAHGSARSIIGINIKDAITEQSDLLYGFGGHSGAAGLSLSPNNIPEFKARISRTIRRMSSGLDLTPKQFIDGFVSLQEISIEFVNEIERLAPFGAGNPPLVLVSTDLHLISHTSIGSTQEHLRLVVGDRDGNTQELLWWRGVGENLPHQSERFDLAYIPRLVTFRGENKIQLQWLDFHPQEIPEIKIIPPCPKVNIVDYRNEPNPLYILETIRSRTKIQVWAEGDAKSLVKGLDRTELAQAESLVIWTIPPGNLVLQEAMEKVKPTTVYIFGHDPEIDDTQAFLTRLMGLLKHVLNVKDGVTNKFTLAANLAHREGTVRLGLFWLEAKGVIKVNYKPQTNGVNCQDIIISKGTNEARIELTEITDELKMMLAETQAYRKYYQRSSVQALNLIRTRY